MTKAENNTPRLMDAVKVARTWPGVPVSFALHEFTSILGLGFAIFHALILLGDHYISYTLVQVLVPFSSSDEPVWVGIGQVGFYAMMIVTLSFYMRSHIGQETWRSRHCVSFRTYLIALLHGITAGSDTSLLREPSCSRTNKSHRHLLQTMTRDPSPYPLAK